MPTIHVDPAATAGTDPSPSPNTWKTCAARQAGRCAPTPPARGPDRVFDLDNEAERIELHQIVLTDGTVEDICGYLNHTELMRLWTRLWLPAHVRQAWEPLLGVVAS